MSNLKPRWDLSEVEVSNSSIDAALSVVRRLTAQRRDAADQWPTAIRLAQANGASLRDIAEVADASPQTISKICKS